MFNSTIKFVSLDFVGRKEYQCKVSAKGVKVTEVCISIIIKKAINLLFRKKYMKYK